MLIGVSFALPAKVFHRGGALSPLLSNIMLNEFDQWMETNYLSKKVRKDRWAWNFGILKRRPITVRENRQWKPAVAYCRYADDFAVVVKGTRAHAQEVREACRAFLVGELKLTLNMVKTHITHVNDGFVFLGHRIIRKRGPRGRMHPVTTIPWTMYRGLAQKLVQELSSNYSENSIDKMERLNRILAVGQTSINSLTARQRCSSGWTASSSGSSVTGSRASVEPRSRRFAAVGYEPRRRDEPRRGFFRVVIVGDSPVASRCGVQ